MSKHTPGPWIGAGPSFGDPLPRYTTDIVTDWKDGEGAVISICELPFHRHDDENEANARLIAASPDLLEALKGMVQLDEEEHQRGPGDIDICKEVQDAYAAIAKATGEKT